MAERTKAEGSKTRRTRSRRRWLLRLTLGPLALLAAIYGGLVGTLRYHEWRATQVVAPAGAVVAQTSAPHTLTLVDDGPTSFAQRLAIIDAAQRTLELEFFIYELDLASRVLTQRLIDKARQGVKVRLLVDASLAVFKLGPAYADHLRRHGVAVRYYNTSAPYRLLAVNHRSHRKLLIADDAVVMTGGRNIADDYFHASAHFNFLDADVVIRGPIAKRVRETFDLYWASELAAKPPAAPTDAAADAEGRGFVTPSARDREALAFIEKHQTALLASLHPHTCRDLTFATDFPGTVESDRRVFKVLSEVLGEAKRSVVGESPYFVLRRGGLAMIQALSERGVQVRVLTNSLASTDAWYTVSALWTTLGDLAETSAELLAYDGTPAPERLALPLEVADRWGVHAKRAVVDARTAIIGTYNVDPRSANLNSELIVVCRDQPALAAEMQRSIEARMAHARPVVHAGAVSWDALVQGATSAEIARMVAGAPLAWAFDFLL